MPRIAPLRRVLALAALVLCCAPAAAQRPTDTTPTVPDTAQGGIPVLAWHRFTDRPLEEELGSLTEPFVRFEEMLRFLEREGFRSVFPEQARTDGGRQVVLTFDDGPEESMRAAELLERHGFRGIFFVIPARTRADAEHTLTPDDVRRLARAGHRVAVHGYEHRSMASSREEVAAVVARSRRELGDSIATPLDFAFPFGHYTPEVARRVGRSFRYLHTVNPGYWDGRSALLPRMLVMGGVDPALYREYMLGGARYRPRLEPLTPDGAVTERVAFRLRGGPLPAGVELFSVSADAEGRSYVSHPLGTGLEVRGDTVWVDLAAHMRRFYAPERSAIGYALVTREAGQLSYLSPGIQHWIRDPAAGSWLPGWAADGPLGWVLRTAALALLAGVLLLAVRAFARRRPPAG
ncbi:MAG TPA: polysaccharide deacetylase family protein [Longimicrobiaceae bacterium]|jgi:peptidoglycan/xylan/chitin deacetylase (PgdA/CDA1 family)